MTVAPRRTVLFGALAAATLFSQSAQALTPLPPVTLFKVISPRDEIFVGLLTAELETLGAGSPAEAMAKKIAADGQMTVWQYSVRRGDGGALVMAPVARVGIFAAGIVRIEPYATSYQVLSPR
jgi:hypothetical protein